MHLSSTGTFTLLYIFVIPSLVTGCLLNTFSSKYNIARVETKAALSEVNTCGNTHNIMGILTATVNSLCSYK